MGAARGLARVRREALAACMTCPLCRGLLREATAITVCLHTCEFPLLSLSPSLPCDPGRLCPVRSFELSIRACLYPRRPPRGRSSPRVRVRPSFWRRISSCSLVQTPPAIRMVSDASSLILGRVANAPPFFAWIVVMAFVARGRPWWPPRAAFAFASPWPASLLLVGD